jgi:hypothetical protein
MRPSGGVAAASLAGRDGTRWWGYHGKTVFERNRASMSGEQKIVAWL